MEMKMQAAEQNIIRICRPKISINRCRGGAIIRIDGEAANIIESFATQSGLSFTKLASNFIRFAAKHTVIQEEYDGD